MGAVLGGHRNVSVFRCAAVLFSDITVEAKLWLIIQKGEASLHQGNFPFSMSLASETNLNFLETEGFVSYHLCRPSSLFWIRWLK